MYRLVLYLRHLNEIQCAPFPVKNLKVGLKVYKIGSVHTLVPTWLIYGFPNIRLYLNFISHISANMYDILTQLSLNVFLDVL